MAKIKRQQCIRLMEKITKNLFKMFRDKKSTKKQIIEKFVSLKKKLEKLGSVYLDSPYHRAMKTYIDKFDNKLHTDRELEKIRDINMTLLNRIQKVKNMSSYKKEKHSTIYE